MSLHSLKKHWITLTRLIQITKTAKIHTRQLYKKVFASKSFTSHYDSQKAIKH